MPPPRSRWRRLARRPRSIVAAGTIRGMRGLARGSRGPPRRSSRRAGPRSAPCASTRSSAASTPSATRSQRVMPPKMLMNTAFTAGSDRTTSSDVAIWSALAPPPTSRKFAALRAGLRHDVERGHHEARAVADDPDVAVELHVLQALLVRARLHRVDRERGLHRLDVRVAEQRVVVDRDLGVERHHAPVLQQHERVHLDERGVAAPAAIAYELAHDVGGALARLQRQRARSARARGTSAAPASRRRARAGSPPGASRASSSMSMPPSAVIIAR